MLKPRRCLAAFGESWLVHAPLLCCLLLTPALPPPASPTAAVSRKLAAAQPYSPPPSATPLQPTAAPVRKVPRVVKKRAAAPKKPPVAELKVIHTGSVERPEGELPFGFERVAEHPAPRIALRGPRDAADALMNELIW